MFRHHLNESTTIDQIHGVDHFPKSKGSLFHVYDNRRHLNGQMTKGEYGLHIGWGTKIKDILIPSLGEFDECQMSSPPAMS